MEKNNLVYLRHIIDAIGKIEKYLSGVSEESFVINSLVQDGVIRQLEIIGEATRHLSNEIKQMDDAVPWQDISDMRNKLIHDYFGVDIDTVWITAKEDIPVIKKQIEVIIKNIVG
jgi:uncharacterized protein with HEPN domain